MILLKNVHDISKEISASLKPSPLIAK